MSIKSGKIATGASKAPMTVDQVKDTVRATDTAVTSPIIVPAGKTMIAPNAEINSSITVASVTTFYGLLVNPGGSITIDPTRGKLAT